MLIQRAVDSVFDKVGHSTKSFMSGTGGKIVNIIIILSPLTFLPTLYAAFTADNIDAMRNLTWPLFILTNLCACMSLAQQGNWVMRLVQSSWVLIFIIMTAVIVVR